MARHADDEEDWTEIRDPARGWRHRCNPLVSRELPPRVTGL
jgi:hypothetical protein